MILSHDHLKNEGTLTDVYQLQVQSFVYCFKMHKLITKSNIRNLLNACTCLCVQELTHVTQTSELSIMLCYRSMSYHVKYFNWQYTVNSTLFKRVSEPKPLQVSFKTWIYGWLQGKIFKTCLHMLFRGKVRTEFKFQQQKLIFTNLNIFHKPIVHCMRVQECANQISKILRFNYQLVTLTQCLENVTKYKRNYSHPNLK